MVRRYGDTVVSTALDEARDRGVAREDVAKLLVETLTPTLEALRSR